MHNNNSVDIFNSEFTDIETYVKNGFSEPKVGSPWKVCSKVLNNRL